MKDRSVSLSLSDGVQSQPGRTGGGRREQGTAGAWSPLGPRWPALPDVIDDEVRWGNEEIVHSCKGCADEVLTLAGAGFRDHLQHRPRVLVRAHSSRGVGTWRPLHFLLETPSRQAARER